ncbi:MAG: hypothetical protein QF473_37555 [Planctomycetota bacterium]|jgi:hypothetical protein|nr:hypothetical protein [Planctomycetota bacterium]
MAKDVLASNAPEDMWVGFSINQPRIPSGMPDHIAVIMTYDGVEHPRDESFAVNCTK